MSPAGAPRRASITALGAAGAAVAALAAIAALRTFLAGQAVPSPLPGGAAAMGAAAAGAAILLAGLLRFLVRAPAVEPEDDDAVDRA
jgi:hypothetical protein